MSYDPERNISWDEISPSFRAKFKKIAVDISNNASGFISKKNENKIFIGPDPPSNPEEEKTIWFDTSSDDLSMKYYSASSTWEVTRGAWYGGSRTDVVPEEYSISATKDNIDAKSMQVFTYVSNPAENNTYTAPTDMYTTGSYTISLAGKYLIRDMSTTFPYNKQKKYEHDGGSIRVQVFRNGSTILDNTYDSKLKWRAYDYTTNKAPEVILNLNKGDKISYKLDILRNPKSTDDIDMFFIMRVFIYALIKSNYIDIPMDERTEF